MCGFGIVREGIAADDVGRAGQLVRRQLHRRVEPLLGVLGLVSGRHGGGTCLTELLRCSCPEGERARRRDAAPRESGQPKTREGGEQQHRPRQDAMRVFIKRTNPHTP